MKKLSLFYLLLGLSACVVLAMHSCANIGYISGGDKDSIPPVMVASRPIPFDTGFHGHNIVLTFDEFIQYKNVNQEFFSSPPFEKVPDFKVKRKSAIIKLKEPLKDSVTYVMNFGNAITDFFFRHTQPLIHFLFQET
jgi:hypothetical protein